MNWNVPFWGDLGLKNKNKSELQSQIMSCSPAEGFVFTAPLQHSVGACQQTTISNQFGNSKAFQKTLLTPIARSWCVLFLDKVLSLSPAISCVLQGFQVILQVHVNGDCFHTLFTDCWPAFYWRPRWICLQSSMQGGLLLDQC